MLEPERIHDFLTWEGEGDITKLLQGDAGNLLHGYSHIAHEDMEGHVKRIAKTAYDVWHYPCFQMFWFLRFELSRSSVYHSILQAVKSGKVLADLGCAFGQDLRYLTYQGAPSENLVGLDLRQDFINLGYELFNDRSTFKARFLTQDFFADTPAILDLLGKVDIINAGYFLHSWDWDGQLQCSKRMIQLMSPSPGAIMTGIQFGSHATGLWSTTPSGVEAGPIFLHDNDTLKTLWDQAAQETQTSWDVQITVEEDPECTSFDPQGCHLRWVVTRK
ncbi:uncharacterized protein BDW43DRAFT_324032 [Aspergillus alliaceus]|uniref:uncharacterized protein n=1 Tax=Petromyces alliaceus TaxID=209559 RepID=UPI0012A4C679|nr:uncharacterized protein BDW43DRAFT_324032 [Aspergillus alliaceus]KAB8227340.1 hypothetical protein BDW43DRAFT_324032 [Aspergillus alliaceus]